MSRHRADPGCLRRRRLLLWPALAWLPPRPARAQQGPLRVVGSADPPYRVFRPDGTVGGLYYELLDEAARRLGWALHYLQVPSARALRMMEVGEADLMMGPLRTPERELFLSYTRIQLPAEDKAFYTLPEAPPVRSLQDLRGRRVVVQRGKRYGAALHEAAGLQLTEVNDYRSALEMVARGRVDVAVLPERQGDLLLRGAALGLVKQPWRLPGEAPYVVLARSSPWLVRQAEMERAFQAMREDGSWQAIVARYR